MYLLKDDFVCELANTHGLKSTKLLFWFHGVFECWYDNSSDLGLGLANPNRLMFGVLEKNDQCLFIGSTISLL